MTRPKPRTVRVPFIGRLRLLYTPGQPREVQRPEGDHRQVKRHAMRRQAKLAADVFKGEIKRSGIRKSLRRSMKAAGTLFGWRGNPPDWRGFYGRV